MSPHSPPEILVVVLITCPNCLGSEFFDHQGESCACHVCASGYQSVALPFREVLIVAALPEERQYPALLELAGNAKAVRHPLLFQSGLDVPPKFAPNLRMSPSDKKILAQRIALTKTP